MYSYLAITWVPGDVRAQRIAEATLSALRAKPRDWTLVYHARGVIAAQSAARSTCGSAHALQLDCGVVLGTLFSRSTASNPSHAVGTFDEHKTRTILATAGEHLVEHYWGAYLALIVDRQRGAIHILRDPTATLPCFRVSWQGVEILFSCIHDCVGLLPIPLHPNVEYLGVWLAQSGLTSKYSALAEVEEVAGGERITVSQSGTVRKKLWDPHRFASEPRFEQPEDAARGLRRAVQDSVDAWSSCYRKVGLKLSGGLDSSIVAGCLASARSKPEMSFMTLAVGGGDEAIHLPELDNRTAARMRALAASGDERHLARLVAERWNTSLVEHSRSAEIDFRHRLQVPLAMAPSMFLTEADVDDAEIQFVNATGVQAIFSGLGGDSAFLATTQPFAAVDHLYLHGLTRVAGEHLLATARLSRHSLWSVLGKTLRHGLARRPYPLPRATRPPPFLSDGTVFDVQTKLVASSSEQRAPLPPGKLNHVTGVGEFGFYNCVFNSGRYVDHVDPLNSQPIWETVLRIPTYALLAGGVSRGLARRAFMDLLPSQIARRQVKGTGTPFYQRMVRANMPWIREILLEGSLLRIGVLDRQKLLECLGANEPFMIAGATDILAHVAAELWLQQWETNSHVASLGRANAASL